MEESFNPSKITREDKKRKRIREALDVLDKIEYMDYEDWERLRNILIKVLSRDLVRWRKEGKM